MGEHEYRYYYEHGRCYTFRPGAGHLPPPGSQYGLKFIMNYKYFPIQSSEKEEKIFDVFSDRSFGGWDIFVHDPDEDWSENEPLTDSYHEHFFVEKGFKAQIKLGQSIYHTLNTESDPCRPGSVTHCKEKCRWRMIMESVNITCKLPFAYPKALGPLNVKWCNKYEESMTMMTSYRDWVKFNEDCSKECIRNCAGKLFSGELLRTERLRGGPAPRFVPASNVGENEMAIIDIFFSSGMYLSMEEEIA